MIYMIELEMRLNDASAVLQTRPPYSAPIRRAFKKMSITYYQHKSRPILHCGSIISESNIDSVQNRITNMPDTNPPQIDGCTLSYPAPFVLLLTINREKQMNSIPSQLHWQMDAVFRWFDSEPSLRVAVITGAGKKAFCAGQDLIEMGKAGVLKDHPSSGFAGISRRVGKKPIIAAVNGFALGGGFEIVLNCDMVVAAPTARFGLPEALRGIYAAAGGLPRLIRNVGLPISSEIAMSGRQLSANEGLRYNLINSISKSQATVVDEAVQLATKVANISPDAIIVTRLALREAWETASVEKAYQISHDRFRQALFAGENAKEGLKAFAEKRQPNWVPSKL
ncbi:hypothetical protein BT93_L4723 [Corymbia citriodora subsp. variegata]|uniref:Enoyl-CoA hydratase n=1 Tax=Corymbia citriodora subsp. variegata TaxID=360336 RepID=A0A8T0CFS5_CORYI|nr:hypothetical protein BT93_L4723 [Corymbia citriodora subsp. variegata]